MFNGYTGAQFLEETLHHWSKCIVLEGMIKEISCNSNDELGTPGVTAFGFKFNGGVYGDASKA